MRLCHVMISQKSALALVSARSQAFWELTPVLTIATHPWKCWSRLPQRGSPSQFLMSRSLDSVVPKPRHTDLLRKLHDSAKARRVVAERGKAIQERAIIRIRDGRCARKDPTQRTVVPPRALPRPGAVRDLRIAYSGIGPLKSSIQHWRRPLFHLAVKSTTDLGGNVPRK